VAQARADEALEHHLRSLLRQPAAQEAPRHAGRADDAGDAGAGAAADVLGGEVRNANETARRQLAIVERWGCLDKARLSRRLLEQTKLAVFSNKTVILESIMARNGPSWQQFCEADMVEENITQLVADGADVNFRFREMHGWTALHWAAAYGAAEVCRLLVSNCSADLEVRSDNGGTALHYAAFNGHADVVHCLVELGAHIEARNEFEQTALHLAVMPAANASTVALVELGADVLAKDVDGMTPRDLLQDNDWSSSRVARTVLQSEDIQMQNATFHFIDKLLVMAEASADTMDT